MTHAETIALRELCSPRVYFEGLRRESVRRAERQKNLGNALRFGLLIVAFLGAILL